MTLHSLRRVGQSRIATKSHLLGVKSGDQSLEDPLPVSHHRTCKWYAQIPIRKRALRVVENLCLNLPVWLGPYCTRIKTDVGAGFLAVNSINSYEHLCATDVQGWQILSLVINKESTESFASNWRDWFALKLGSSALTR